MTRSHRFRRLALGDAEMAALLSKALRTSRGFWTALQADHDRWLTSTGLEKDERFLARTKAARASLRAGRGTRLEDVQGSRRLGRVGRQACDLT